MKRILIILLFLTQITIIAQSYVSSRDSISILDKLNTKYNIEYSIDDIINVDSLEVHYDENRDIIDNEYGTLDNCIIFTASKKNQYSNCNAIVGVFKNGIIKWCSDYLIPSSDIYAGGIIDGVRDLNNNGKVEIITIWTSSGGSSYNTQTLFLHTWDGNIGKISVDLSRGESPIGVHENGVFNYVDIEGDGIWEIVSESYGSNPEVAVWNGINYSLNGAPALETMDRFFPRNNFIAKVKTKVKKREEKYLYSYEVYNSEESKQEINQFDVFGFDEYVKLYGSIYNETDDLKTYAKNWTGKILSTCIVWKGIPIESGKNQKGFTYLVEGLPIIGKAYLRGANYCSYPGDYRENTSVKDFLTNSVIVKTLASRLPLSPFIPNNFIDTLKSYNTQSYNLGWIKEEATYNKYSEYLTKAKTSLEAQDTTMAVINLENILSEVDKDSSTALTSEAYALLKFNTEYLVKQLPEVKIENLLDALINKSHESYHTRWIFKYSVYVNIVKRLNNIKKAYLSNRLTRAEYMLDSFLEKLARQRSKGITEECYQYYKHYVNYIKDKL